MLKNLGNDPGATEESGSPTKSKRFFFRLCPIPPENFTTSTATRSCRDPETAVIHCWLPGGVRRRPQRVTSAGPPPAAVESTSYGRRRCYYGQAPPLLQLLLLVLLYSHFCD